MNQLESEILDLSNALSLTGYFWTSTFNVSDTIEYGQVTDIDVERHPVMGGNDTVSILGSDSAMTLTLLLIEDITP